MLFVISRAFSISLYTNAVLKPAFFAATKSFVWAAHIIISSGETLNSSAACRYEPGSGLYCLKNSQDIMPSQLMPLNFEQSTPIAQLNTVRGTTVYLLLSLSMASGASSHASNLCQTLFRSSRSASDNDKLPFVSMTSPSTFL